MSKLILNVFLISANGLMGYETLIKKLIFGKCNNVHQQRNETRIRKRKNHNKI